VIRKILLCQLNHQTTTSE